jgi:predicted component of type VI protein secretion system
LTGHWSGAMHQPKITMRLNGGAAQIEVKAARFTIGSGLDNDLVIDDPGLSRRHTLIETYEGLVQISDCGSEDGTFVNGKRLAETIELWDGAQITIGAGCHIAVRIDRSDSQSMAQGLPESGVQPGPEADSQGLATFRAINPLMALAGLLIMLLVAVPVILFLSRDRNNRAAGRAPDRQSERLETPAAPQVENQRPDKTPAGASAQAITVEQVEEAAVQFMRRISNDDRPYVFPPYAIGALQELRQRVEQYAASPALNGALNSLAASAPTIAAQARREGIEPALVIYTALADRERTAEDPLAIARRTLPDLLGLRKTLGTESADKALVVVAAYKTGGGTKKSHPLIRTMTRVVMNPLTDRNVWYLHNHQGLTAEAYDFILRFLALGVIGENPRRFGVSASPIAY